MPSFKDLVKKIEDNTDFTNYIGKTESEIIKEANLSVSVDSSFVEKLESNIQLIITNLKVDVSISPTLQEQIIEIVTGGGNKAWEKIQSIIDAEIDKLIDIIGADTILNASADLQEELSKVAVSNAIATHDVIVSTYNAIMEKMDRTGLDEHALTVSEIIGTIVENIYIQLEKLGITSVFIGFSINYYIFSKLADILAKMVERGKYTGKNLSLSIVDNNIPSINWEKLMTQNVNYVNDFLLVLNDASLLLEIVDRSLSKDKSVNDFNTTLAMAIRNTSVPILIVKASTGSSKYNLPLLSLSKIGWHIEDVVLNSNIEMELKFRDFLWNNRFLHQYFEEFIKKYVITYFEDKVDVPLSGAFVDELSLSFSLYLFTHSLSQLKIIKRVDFLFLPLEVNPTNRSYSDSSIADFSIKGVSVFYKTKDQTTVSN